jgi:hypothetical protein
MKELAGNSHESRRVEETSEGGQDCMSCSADDDDDDMTVGLLELPVLTREI